MSVLDANPLDRDPQGTAMLRDLLSAGRPATREPRAGASMRAAAAEAVRRRVIIATLQFGAVEPLRGTEVWLDPSPA